MIKKSLLQPRERLKYYGVEKLSNCELIEIILRQGTKKQSVHELAVNCLRHYRNLFEFRKASVEELEEIEGIGFAKACELIAAMELGYRLFQEENEIYGEVLNSKKFGEHVSSEMCHYDQEVFMVYCLNIRNEIIAKKLLFKGSMTESIAHPREIFNYAIKHLAVKIIVAHNHPSGNYHPSHQDIELTKRLYQAGMLLGIELLDHFIVGGNHYLSLKEEQIF